RSRSRGTGGDTGSRDDAVVPLAVADGESGPAAEPRTPRRRRRTRSGRDVAREAAAESAAPSESAQQAS
ncbi:MAG: hypothetical protein ACRDN0_16405, partial [Trebonia sp.]